jgi:ATP-dependent RNA helicase DeaD
MVFCNTKRTTDIIERNLNEFGVEALAIHGGHSQEKRNRTMENFHEKTVSVMVCTDVAARGLDIKGVSHVYNYEAPKDSKDYIHRIGRTARAGEQGKVINIISQPDYENFRRIVHNQELNICREEIPQFERVNADLKPHYPKRRFSSNRRYSRGESSRSNRFGRNRNSSNRRFSRRGNSSGFRRRY